MSIDFYKKYKMNVIPKNVFFNKKILYYYVVYDIILLIKYYIFSCFKLKIIKNYMPCFCEKIRAKCCNGKQRKIYKRKG